jgi:hypothetical protein
MSCICTGGPLPTEIQNPGNLQVDTLGIACTSLPSEELWKHLLSHLMMLMEWNFDAFHNTLSCILLA